MRNLWRFFTTTSMKLGQRLFRYPFSQLTLKNLDGPRCRIFCVLGRHYIWYTTYHRPRPINYPSRVQVRTYNLQIAPNHCPMSYFRYFRKRNRLSGDLFAWFLSNLLKKFF